MLQAPHRLNGLPNFKLIESGVDLGGIRKELNSSSLWRDMGARPNRPPTQAGSMRIQLRTNESIPGQHYHDIQKTRDLPSWDVLHNTRSFVERVACNMQGAIGHVRVSKLNGGSVIIPHIDVGQYCAMRDRYHLVIESERGTLFRVDEEEIVMREGELWWFDNKKIHSVKNLSDKARSHLIFDLLPLKSEG
jgi:Aspartyl/Asparaginyl beta-hydroxylase